MSENRKVIIVGAGGHARVIAGLLQYRADVEVIGVADRGPELFGESIGTTRISATFDQLSELHTLGVSMAALAIGDNTERAEMFAHLRRLGFDILSLIHPTAILEQDVQLGVGVVICAGAILCTQVRLGDNVLINTGSIIDHEGRIDAHAHIAPGSRLAGRVHVGERTFVGIGTTVKDHINIGARSIIGSGSVVISDIPHDVVAYGVPAKVQRHV